MNAIKIEDLSKRYSIGKMSRYETFRDLLANQMVKSRCLTKKIFLPFRKSSSDDTDCHYIWALKNIDAEVKMGGALGVIGPNGAGKSTLLKILSRITEPTSGQIKIWGRVGSLLEVGTGFHSELTGRENIYLNGAILGMKKSEVKRKFDAIVSFSGVEKFVDTPVKHYSTGMHVRLAFAVAAHLDTEILLVDEVLAVGDAAFQEKCIGKMSEEARMGRTIVLVSHNMAAVRNLCTDAILIDRGRIRHSGKAEETVQAYLSGLEDSRGREIVCLADRKERNGSGSVRMTDFEAKAVGLRAVTPQMGAPAEFVLDYKIHKKNSLPKMHWAISVVDVFGVKLFTCASWMSGQKALLNPPTVGRIICKIPSLPLMPGKYWVDLLVKDSEGVADQMDRACSFHVVDSGASSFFVLPSKKWGSVLVPHDWQCVSMGA